MLKFKFFTYFIWFVFKFMLIFVSVITTKENFMKELFSLVAIKLVENNISEEALMVCGSILKESFIKEGFERVIANEFAIDSLKIILKTLNR